MTRSLLGAVEAGGTKFRAAVVAGDMTILESCRVPTSDPETTLAAVSEFFAGGDPVAALGIASFGPLDLDPASQGYGSITATPKPSWSGTNIVARLSESLGVPADIQTDVESAAVAEQCLAPAPRPERLAYVTVGTGIGAAIAAGGAPVRGRRHSELGHIPVRRVSGDDYPGRCPFHGDCLEGMACGPAMAERWGIDPSDITDPTADLSSAGGHCDIWQLEAGYLAQLVRVLAYSLAPDRIVFGGGVGARHGLAPMILARSRVEMGGYADYGHNDDAFVTDPALGEDSGLLGAALLARALLER